MKGYRIFSTTADVGIDIWGETYEQLYEQALWGFNELVLGKAVPDANDGRSLAISFDYSGDSPENVLVHFLSEVSYLLYVKTLAIVRLKIQLADIRNLRALLFCRDFVENPLLEIKSTTYHNLRVTGDKNGMMKAAIVFDI